MSKPGFHQQWQVSRKMSLVQPGRRAEPLGSPSLMRSKSGSAASCLEKLLLLFSSGISDEISVSTPQCPLIQVQFLAACFQPRAPVSSDMVSHPWLGEPSGHKHVGFARNSCLYPGKNPTKRGSLFTIPSLCHCLPKICKPGWEEVLQQASLTTHL